MRTLEGDIYVDVTEQTVFMIGIQGEVYPIEKTKFERSYQVLDGEYSCQAVYQPIMKK